ncbi:transcription initiation factor IIB, partial [Kickxella alabastrina]
MSKIADRKNAKGAPLSSPDKKWSVVLMCPDCRKEPPNIVEDFASGDLVCGDCGL